MQSNLSSKFTPILNVINEEKVKDLSGYLKYHTGGHISCNDIANRLDISFDEARNIIAILLKNDVVEMNFMVDCCNKYDTNNKIIYETFEEIPKETCYNCEKVCQLLNKVIVVYKVLYGDLYV